MSDPSPSPLPSRRANADYTVVDRTPVLLLDGELVEVGQPDQAWEGWVWVSNAADRGTYVPVTLLEQISPDQARLREAFQAVDLCLKKGETVSCLREVCGWFWCRNAAGAEGWVPDYVLS